MTERAGEFHIPEIHFAEGVLPGTFITYVVYVSAIGINGGKRFPLFPGKENKSRAETGFFFRRLLHALAHMGYIIKY